MQLCTSGKEKDILIRDSEEEEKCVGNVEKKKQVKKESGKGKGRGGGKGRGRGARRGKASGRGKKERGGAGDEDVEQSFEDLVSNGIPEKCEKLPAVYGEVEDEMLCRRIAVSGHTTLAQLKKEVT